MPYISPITWMEVMAGVNPEAEAPVRQFLNRFTQVDINSQVAAGAVAIRRQHRMKLPDAIIWASAQSISALLVSRNKKDFPPDEPGVRIPYEL
jgi:predicted nucleic acid-binding protein